MALLFPNRYWILYLQVGLSGTRTGLDHMGLLGSNRIGELTQIETLFLPNRVGTALNSMKGIDHSSGVFNSRRDLELGFRLELRIEEDYFIYSFSHLCLCGTISFIFFSLRLLLFTFPEEERYSSLIILSSTPAIHGKYWESKATYVQEIISTSKWDPY